MTNNEYQFLNGFDTYLEHINHRQYEKFSQIRKAILYGNVYQMRNLIIDEVYRGPTEHVAEFAKAILSYHLDPDEYNARRVLSYISYCIDDEYVRNAARWSIQWQKLYLDDHFSRGQMMSKLWLVEQLEKVMQLRADEGKPVENIVQYGGWYSTVAWFVLKNPQIKQYISLDVDDSCVAVADGFNAVDYANNWRFKAATFDVNQIQWENNHFDIDIVNAQGRSVPMTLGPQLIINTSCEHMTDDWFHNLPKGKLVCLHTNDYFSNEQHINCVESVDAAVDKYPFERLYYADELDTPVYKRFMLIGRT